MRNQVSFVYASIIKKYIPVKWNKRNTEFNNVEKTEMCLYEVDVEAKLGYEGDEVNVTSSRSKKWNEKRDVRITHCNNIEKTRIKNY